MRYDKTMLKIREPQNMRDSVEIIKKVLDSNISYIQTESEDERERLLTELEYWEISYKLRIKKGYIWIIVDNKKSYNKALLQLLRAESYEEALHFIERTTGTRDKHSYLKAGEVLGIL